MFEENTNGTIGINISDSGDYTAITRTLSTVDPLASMIDAFADAVMAEGYGDDSRFIELQNHWQDMILDELVDAEMAEYDDGQYDEPQDEAAPYYTGMPFLNGDVVEVLRETAGSETLAGRVGVVTADNCDLVEFPGWTDGHGDFDNQWCCEPRDLRLVYRR